MMRTDADLCREAAAVLRDLLSRTTAGQWWVHPDGRDVWAGDRAAIEQVDAGDYVDEAHAEELMGRAAPLGYGELRNPADAEWIALVGPVFGASVVALLESAAEADLFFGAVLRRRVMPLVRRILGGDA